MGLAIAQAADPAWWTTEDVVSGTAEDYAPANIGQAKWITMQAHEELAKVLPGGAGFDLYTSFDEKPASPSASWYEDQLAVLNVGQLKNLAAPFYDRLHEVAPDWLEDQMDQNDTDGTGTHYPWTATTSDDNDYGPANLGQLKAAFCLRFHESNDTPDDGVSDLAEEVYFGSTALELGSDSDSDGLSDLEELARGLNPFDADTDGDGTDDDEDDLPFDPDEDTITASQGDSTPPDIVVISPEVTIVSEDP